MGVQCVRARSAGQADLEVAAPPRRAVGLRARRGAGRAASSGRTGREEPAAAGQRTSCGKTAQELAAAQGIRLLGSRVQPVIVVTLWHELHLSTGSAGEP